MKHLRITSFLGTNTYPTIKAIAGILSREFQIPVQFVYDIPWPERMIRLSQGEIQIGWMCGLEYIKQVFESPGGIELLAAPVFSGDRYNNRPVYFSDIIVRTGSPFQSFDQLRGVTWVFNERRSYSGYYTMCRLLSDMGEDTTYFGQLLEAGSHLKALQMVLDSRAEVTAIDSTILDFELARQPELGDQVRVIQCLGPFPVPPWVVSKRLPMAQRLKLRNLVLQMAESGEGKAILEMAGLTGFVQVEDATYDSIRRVANLVDY